MSVKIALVGNPNSGKTTLFNALTGGNQFVGNWPGVTVEKKEGKLKEHGDALITDLPGVYSLSPYSPEEIVTRNYLLKDRPDVVLNIVDGTNLERNLFLTTQLTELGIPVVVALNKIDAVKKNGDKIDVAKLCEKLGCPIIEVCALKGGGVNETAAAALKAAKSAKSEPKEKFAGDEERYAHIENIMKSCAQIKDGGEMSVSDKIDKVVTDKRFALPIFAAVIFVVYFISVSTVGSFATDWANDGLFGDGWEMFGLEIPGIPVILSEGLQAINCAEWLQGLVVDGIVAGVGAVLGFVPQMLILFLFLAFLEACGYMARVAFIMDRFFRGLGLSGKSFIPFLIGTGCSVPAIMATRTIESERERKMTVLTTSFIPCSAKLPIIAMISGAIFGGAWWVAPSAYFVGVAAVICSALILKRTKLFAGEPSVFVMELPPYQLPLVKNVLSSMWERGREFIKKAGTIILLASIFLWFAANFGWSEEGFGMVDMDESILAKIGAVLAIFFVPLGWGNWQAAVAAITGLIAKETVVGTFGVLYAGLEEVSEDGQEIWAALRSSFTAVSAYSFLVFNLLCAPCFAAIAAIRAEMRSAKWFWVAIGYQCVFAYVAAFFVYQIGRLIFG